MSSPSPRPRTVFLLILAIVVLAVAPATAAAADSRGGGTVVVEAGETTGDLEAFGGDVVVRGTVDGDLEAFAGNVRIVGNVTGDVETAAGNVLVAGSVDGDVSASGGNVVLAETGSVGGTFETGAGSVRIDGAVGEDVRAAAESIAVGPTATVGGDLRYDGELDLADGATIQGDVVEDPGLAVGGPVPDVPWLALSVYFFLVNLLVGAILLLAFPDFSKGLVGRTERRPLVTGLVGFGVLVGMPILLAIVAVTVIGIPLALVGAFAYVLAIWIGWIYGRYLLGAWLLSLLDRENRWAALLLGFVLMAILGRVPWIGGLIEFGLLLWGLGALALGLVAAYRGARGRPVDATTTGDAGDASTD